jgi:hypothetical protein
MSEEIGLKAHRKKAHFFVDRAARDGANAILASLMKIESPLRQ